MKILWGSYSAKIDVVSPTEVAEIAIPLVLQQQTLPDYLLKPTGILCTPDQPMLECEQFQWP